MNKPSDLTSVDFVPKKLKKINEWKASILQSVLLFISFAIITVGVALEAKTPSGIANGFWAFNLVIPATGFMLSLANWYFVSLYKSRKVFSNCSLVATLVITVCAYIWAEFHYELNFTELLSGNNLLDFVMLDVITFFYSIGIVLIIVFCVLSKLLSNKYAAMLGKE